MAKRKQQFLTDSKGREYPLDILNPDLVKRDRIVRRIVARAESLNKRIIDDKTRMNEEAEKYLDDLAAQRDAEWKGNAELVSFDKLLKVEISNRDVVTFGPTIQLAKQKLQEYIENAVKGVDPLILAIIDDILKIDKRGQIPRTRLLSLRKYRSKDKAWNDALELINEAIDVNDTRTYLNVYTRASVDDSWNLVNLNFSRA